MSQNIIIMAKQRDPFARVTKSMLDNPLLSWRAKGILSYLLGKPSGWKLRITDVRKHGQDGERAIRASLKELRENGYAQLSQVRDGCRIVEWAWKISDSPIFKKLDGGNAHLEKTELDGRNEHVAFEHLQNEHVQNDHSSKKDSSKAVRKATAPPPPASRPSATDGEAERRGKGTRRVMYASPKSAQRYARAKRKEAAIVARAVRDGYEDEFGSEHRDYGELQ